MTRRATFVYDDLLTRHVLKDTHPLKAVRLRYTYDLLEAYGAFDPVSSLLVGPRQASAEELLAFHTAEYLDAVRRLGAGDTSVAASAFNLGPGDNPHYEGMYEAALWSTGASLVAAEMLIAGEVEAAFSISGGLHHAMPGYAYGFCVFNDPVIAITGSSGPECVWPTWTWTAIMAMESNTPSTIRMPYSPYRCTSRERSSSPGPAIRRRSAPGGAGGTR